MENKNYKYNIKFKLVKFEYNISFQILEQTDLWKRKEKRIINEENGLEINSAPDLEFTSKNGLTIKSSSFTSLSLSFLKKINLRSLEYQSYFHNFIVSNTFFDDNTQRDKYYNAIIESLKEWSVHVYKITNREPQEPRQIDENTFEF